LKIIVSSIKTCHSTYKILQLKQLYINFECNLIQLFKKHYDIFLHYITTCYTRKTIEYTIDDNIAE